MTDKATNRNSEKQTERVKTHRLTLRIPSKLCRRFARYATVNNETVSKLVADAMEYWWKRKVPEEDRGFYVAKPPSKQKAKSSSATSS